jgi:hypothetical protein
MPISPRFCGRKATQSLLAQNRRQVFETPMDTFCTSQRLTLTQTLTEVKLLFLHIA